MSTRKQRKKPKGPLHRRLVLAGFLLRELGFASFEAAAEHLRDPELESVGEDGVSRHCAEIMLRRDSAAPTDDPTLLGYDDAIVRHTKQISTRRGGDLRWRYFQYLALLISERFLDRWFTDHAALIDDLNAAIAEFNTDAALEDAVSPYTAADLRKFALWCATGSGKTLLMHVNLLQFRDHQARHGRTSETNKIILLTPNEGLSRQHVDELRLSGFDAALFRGDDPGLFAGTSVEVLDIQKLRESKGDKTFAVSSFGENNLVLVDEGHRGGAGETWMEFRERLCKDGFSFEYSATFGQAFAGNPEISDRYAKWIGFDYAYRRFHTDGYGKDYRIVNLPSDDEVIRRDYLGGAMLTFLQQRRLFEEQTDAIAPFEIDAPLWVFVGSSVTGKLGRPGQTDVIEILLAFARFLAEPRKTAALFDRYLTDETVLLDASGGSLFEGRFRFLYSLGPDGEAFYRDMLKRVFNCSVPGKLGVVLRKGADGEIALRVGNNAPFGVVNVGDARELYKLCQVRDEFACDEEDAGSSLFAELDSDARLCVLIGAKKFIEGWNSWRVSTLGLMNVGRGEGAQIIQLFGRGVRLRGYAGGLKRSSAVEPPPPDIPVHLALLETLEVFGVRADYMARFREHLQQDGVATDPPVHVELATKRLDPWPTALKIIRLAGDARFGRSQRARLRRPEHGKPKPISLDWYPRVQAMASEGLADPLVSGSPNKNASPLQAKHVAFLDLDRVLAELVRFKRQRGFANLEITSDAVADLLAHPADWYELQIPGDRLRATGPEQIREWEDIAIALLKSWSVRIYRYDQGAWEQPRLRCVPLAPDDANIFETQTVTAPAVGPFVIALKEMKADLAAGRLTKIVDGLEVIDFDRHCYQPLLAMKHGGQLRVKPTPLNLGEDLFVKDVREWASTGGDGVLADRSLYVLRNQARGHGVGFHLADNFYPDFLVWLVGPDARQQIVFVDPKGIARLGSVDHPKIQLSQTIKRQEQALGDPDVLLSSFIVSVTRFSDVAWFTSGTKADLEDLHVLFQPDDRLTYVADMFRRALADTAGAPR